MAAQLDPNPKDDLKTQFVTREGTYRLLTLSEYSRPNRVGYTCNQSSPQVRVSLVTLPNVTAGTDAATLANCAIQSNQNNNNNNNKLVNSNNNISDDSATTTTNSPVNNNNNNSTNGNNFAATGGGSGGGDGTALLINRQQQTYALMTATTAAATGMPSTLDARLGAVGGSITMQSMLNGDSAQSSQAVYGGDRICFNFGRELYVYAFRGVKKGTEISKPIDKTFYKVTNPSCHDFNVNAATPTGAPLLVGFTTGQIQLVSPQSGPREIRKFFNEERLIDKTKVTCLKWLPSSPNHFLASHASGHLYLYNEDLPCTATAPTYQPFKIGDGYTILTCKSKSTRNPLYKWVFTTDNCCINEFSFSPCGTNLAIVSQDGFLRVFHYDTMELLGIARSYFGGFLCVCWSPDGKYIVVGGEDDLVTVWSLHERRVVARGQGHRSWVSVVAFDPYTTSYTSWDGGDFSDDEQQINDYAAGREARLYGVDASTSNGYDYATSNDNCNTPNHTQRTQRTHTTSFRSDASSTTGLPTDKLAITYRLGSVGQDTQICLWDITEDVLRHPYSLRQRVNSVNLNDTSYMNGSIETDGVRVIRPTTISNNSGSFPAATVQQIYSPLKDNTSAATAAGATASTENNSNSSSSKFSTANCTISSHSSNANTPQDDAPTSNVNNSKNHNINNNNNNSNNNNNKATTNASCSNSIKLTNCVSATKSDSLEGNNLKSSSSTFSTSGYNSKASNSSSKSSDSSSGISAFNSLTQRLTNFGFLNNSSDKKVASSTSIDIGTNVASVSQRQPRKSMSLLKNYNQNNNSNNNQYNNHSKFGNSSTIFEMNSAAVANNTAYSFGSLKIGGKSNSSYASAAAAAVSNTVVCSYDPMKLIGTPACPRFDECPLLEPLVCKKIAHERLTALIFREDCFLTACQDGFIYTWARPGYATNVAQHLSPSQPGPPGGTVI